MLLDWHVRLGQVGRHLGYVGHREAAMASRSLDLGRQAVDTTLEPGERSAYLTVAVVADQVETKLE